MVTLVNKWLFIILVTPALYMSTNLNGIKIVSGHQPVTEVHPLHVSVTEINLNTSEKILEISCRIFTDDFEKVLARNYKTKVDLINSTDRAAMEKLVSDFVQQHLLLKADNRRLQLEYLGYERDNDAIYCYLQVENMTGLKTLEVNNSILHDVFNDQINLMHVTVGGKRKSVKLDFPVKETVFEF